MWINQYVDKPVCGCTSIWMHQYMDTPVCGRTCIGCGCTSMWTHQHVDKSVCGCTSIWTHQHGDKSVRGCTSIWTHQERDAPAYGCNSTYRDTLACGHTSMGINQIGCTSIWTHQYRDTPAYEHTGMWTHQYMMWLHHHMDAPFSGSNYEELCLDHLFGNSLSMKTNHNYMWATMWAVITNYQLICNV